MTNCAPGRSGSAKQNVSKACVRGKCACKMAARNRPHHHTTPYSLCTQHLSPNPQPRTPPIPRGGLCDVNERSVSDRRTRPALPQPTEQPDPPPISLCTAHRFQCAKAMCTAFFSASQGKDIQNRVPRVKLAGKATFHGLRSEQTFMLSLSTLKESQRGILLT